MQNNPEQEASLECCYQKHSHIYINERIIHSKSSSIWYLWGKSCRFGRFKHMFWIYKIVYQLTKNIILNTVLRKDSAIRTLLQFDTGLLCLPIIETKIRNTKFLLTATKTSISLTFGQWCKYHMALGKICRPQISCW